MKKWFFVIFLILLIFGSSGFNSINAAGSMFSDVAVNHWASGAIEFSASKGFVGGYPDGTFRPSGTITRAEFTSVLVRIAGVKSAKSDLFTDVRTHWAKGAIQSAAAAGLITAVDYGAKFEPNKAVSRLEMARMIARALAHGEAYKKYLAAFDGLYNGDLPFVDYRDIQNANLPLIALTYGARIMNGYPDASFGLNNNATRAEAVVMLKSFYDNKGKAPETFQYMRELKEVAEMGMNAKAVSNLIPQVDLKKDRVELKHANYDVKLKRLYVIPMEGDVVSLYEKKYFWDRALLGNRYSSKNARGHVVGVVEMTPKKSGDRMIFTNSLFLSPSGGVWYEEPSEKYGFIHSFIRQNYRVEKDRTDEIVLYGYYTNDWFYVNLQSDNSDLEQISLLLNPDKKKG